MANKENEKKVGFFQKISGWFGRVFGKIGKFFKEVVAEVKKLSWPSKKELINYCLAVICFCALMALIIGILDFVFGRAFTFLAGLGK